MSADENPKQERMLKAFSDEMLKCLWSITGLTQLLRLEIQKLDLQESLLADSYEFLEAIEQSGNKLIKLLTENYIPQADNLRGDVLPRQILAMLSSDSYSPISAIQGYRELLNREIQKPELQQHLSSELISDIEGLQNASAGLFKVQQQLIDTISQLPNA